MKIKQTKKQEKQKENRHTLEATKKETTKTANIVVY